jgi:hypothetical protein
MLSVRRIRLFLARTFPNVRMFAMPEVWKIEIWERPKGKIVFLPDQDDAGDGDPLRANVRDLVSWTNRTDRKIELAPVAPPDVPNFAQTIPPGGETDFFQLPQGNIVYECKNPQQNHEIITSASQIA